MNHLEPIFSFAEIWCRVWISRLLSFQDENVFCSFSSLWINSKHELHSIWISTISDIHFVSMKSHLPEMNFSSKKIKESIELKWKDKRSNRIIFQKFVHFSFHYDTMWSIFLCICINWGCFIVCFIHIYVFECGECALEFNFTEFGMCAEAFQIAFKTKYKIENEHESDKDRKCKRNCMLFKILKIMYICEPSLN